VCVIEEKDEDGSEDATAGHTRLSVHSVVSLGSILSKKQSEIYLEEFAKSYDLTFSHTAFNQLMRSDNVFNKRKMCHCFF